MAAVIEIEVYGIPLEVTYVTYKGYRGQRDTLHGKPGAGPPLEPDEPPGIEIEAILHEGEDIYELLSDQVIAKITEEVWEALPS